MSNRTALFVILSKDGDGEREMERERQREREMERERGITRRQPTT